MMDRGKLSFEKSAPMGFMSLPRELRDMIYEHILTSTYYVPDSLAEFPFRILPLASWP